MRTAAIAIVSVGGVMGGVVAFYALIDFLRRSMRP